MTISRNTYDGICHLALSGDIKIYDASTNKREMLYDLDKCQHFKLDLSGVEDVDASGLQLLILLRKEIYQRKISFELTEISNPVTKLLEIYRLTDWFLGQS